MKTVGTLTLAMLAAMILLCPAGWADDMAAKASALETRAQAIQSQIDRAKKVNDTVLSSQIDGVKKSIDSLMKQRVNLDAHIAKLEGQMGEIKRGAEQNLQRQLERYESALQNVKSELAGAVAQKAPVQQELVQAQVRQSAPSAAVQVGAARPDASAAVPAPSQSPQPTRRLMAK